MHGSTRNWVMSGKEYGVGCELYLRKWWIRTMSGPLHDVGCNLHLGKWWIRTMSGPKKEV
eukprot:5859448-Ditylum_brightwellii.AAC.1